MKARDIEDVTADVQKRLISMLPGGEGTSAAWAAFCQAWQMRTFARDVLAEDDLDDIRKWTYLGEERAAHMIIRKIADGLKIPNIES